MVNVNANDWIIGNLKQNGYYRVNYENGNWDKLIEQLNNDHTVRTFGRLNHLIVIRHRQFSNLSETVMHFKDHKEVLMATESFLSSVLHRSRRYCHLWR